jgi:hypothetical protein
MRGLQATTTKRSKSSRLPTSPREWQGLEDPRTVEALKDRRLLRFTSLFWFHTWISDLTFQQLGVFYHALPAVAACHHNWFPMATGPAAPHYQRWHTPTFIPTLGSTLTPTPLSPPAAVGPLLMGWARRDAPRARRHSTTSDAVGGSEGGTNAI